MENESRERKEKYNYKRKVKNETYQQQNMENWGRDGDRDIEKAWTLKMEKWNQREEGRAQPCQKKVKERKSSNRLELEEEEGIQRSIS